MRYAIIGKRFCICYTGGITMNIHTVELGESIRDVSKRYGVSPIKLAENNGIGERGRLITGEELLILMPTRTTNARRGERLSDISRRFGVKEERLLGINPELCGSGILYDGQPLTVKYGEPTFGMGIGNGYLYRGCTRESLMRALPYLSYVTICSAVGRGGGVSNLFDDKEPLSLALAAGKLPILRLWLAKDSYERRIEVLRSLTVYARAKGYYGVTLAGNIGSGREGEQLMLEAKKMLLECDIKLFCEADAVESPGYTDYADSVILLYDKIHLPRIPSFDDGERVEFTRYSEKHDSIKAFVDLSPFALVGGKYITKSEARAALLRAHGEIVSSGCESYMLGTAGRGRRERLYIYESLVNTRRKLEMVSELGYYGISFDIARCPIAELLMFRVMYSEGIGMV